MPRNSDVLNRGRFQVQGGGLEESHAWARRDVPTKVDGNQFINELKMQLSPSEMNKRVICFRKATKWVNNAPRGGYIANTLISTSFLPCPPQKDIRVDGEIFSGAAFKD